MRLYSVSVAAGLLSCAGPLAAAPPADSIEYALADTKVKVNLDLVLEECPTVRGVTRVAPTVTLTPVATPGPTFRIGGAELRSWLKKRELALALYENGTLKSVGASTSDRTAAVIGNVFKLATSLVTLGGMVKFEGSDPVCEPEIAATTREMARLKQLLANQRRALSLASQPVRIKAIKGAIDDLAARIADLRTGPLKLSLNTTITAPAAPGTVPVKWNEAAFGKWFGENGPVAAAAFEMAADFTSAAVSPPRLPVESAPPPTCGSSRCPVIAIREPVAGSVSIRPADPVSLPGFEDAKAKIPLSVGQWGGISYFPLKAGFGQTRSVKLELDPFGRKTGIGLNSEARAEAISGGLVGIADAALLFANATSDVKQQTTRITELETQQKYNKLLKCEEIIEAGGFTCPN